MHIEETHMNNIYSFMLLKLLMSDGQSELYSINLLFTLLTMKRVNKQEFWDEKGFQLWYEN